MFDLKKYEEKKDFWKNISFLFLITSFLDSFTFIYGMFFVIGMSARTNSSELLNSTIHTIDTEIGYNITNAIVRLMIFGNSFPQSFALPFSIFLSIIHIIFILANNIISYFILIKLIEEIIKKITEEIKKWKKNYST